MQEESAILDQARTTAAVAAGRLRLPLAGKIWHGQTGNWAGAGIGSSIDFQDHRPYVPGDDPRYINWQAFARSGHYTMKLYREEVSPQIDLLLDTSASMFFEPEKRLRSWELFYFCRESALRTGAALRTYLSSGNDFREVQREELEAQTIELPENNDGALAIGSIPWRPGSLRVVISDLLFAPGTGAPLLPLSHGNGRGILFVLHAQSEVSPDWSGNLSFIDCESGARHRQFVSRELIERYRRNYARHFGEWQQEARRQNLIFARIAAEGDLMEALQKDPIQRGAVESY